MPTIAPFGSWHSAITPASLVSEAVGLSSPSLDSGCIYWLELRPRDGGRQVVVERLADGTTRDLFDAPFSARSKVHEYGGASYLVRDGVCWFTNADDQRVYRVVAGEQPDPLTPAPDAPAAVRYADFALSPDRRALFTVRERHDGATVTNELVVLDPQGGDPPRVIATGHDFYAAPRCAPDGDRLAYLCWDLPDMPWDQSLCYVAAVGRDHSLSGARLVAGGKNISISQLRFRADGVLCYLSDESGYWIPYDEHGQRLGPFGADFCRPDWVLGQSTYALGGPGDLVGIRFELDQQRLGFVADDDFLPFDLPYLAFGDLAADDEQVVVLAGSDTTPIELVAIHRSSSSLQVIKTSRTPIAGVAISKVVAISFVGGDGAESHAYFYPPSNDDYEAPAGTLPPLIVLSHGGPTSSATPVYDVGKQFFTSRGFGVVDVDYGGSSGYGRTYRNRLNGQWGVLDVADCIAAAQHLCQEGLADPERLVIRGGSAGGFTTLAALSTSDAFAAGSSHFGVGDLRSLASDTHKFESRYLDRLVGPWPEAAAIYEDRSPISHADRIHCPMIFFQGLDDAIVPPNQAESMVAALIEHGVPVAYLAFDGESHGFRRAETIERVADAELTFLGRVLGFAPDRVTELTIEHEERLRPLPS